MISTPQRDSSVSYVCKKKSEFWSLSSDKVHKGQAWCESLNESHSSPGGSRKKNENGEVCRYERTLLIRKNKNIKHFQKTH